MANTTTLAEMRNRARFLSMQNATGGTASRQFITDGNLTYLINVALSELHDLLVTEFEDFYEKTNFFYTQANVEDYELASDFYKLLEANALNPTQPFNPSQPRYSMRRYMNRERNMWYGMPFSTMYQIYNYRIVGARTMRLAPVPTTPGQPVLYRYAPQCTPLVADDDVVSPSVPQGWEEYAVYDAAIKCLIRDQNLEPATFLEQKKQDMKQRIITSADDRDANEDARVVNVTRRPFIDGGGWVGMPYGWSGF